MAKRRAFRIDYTAIYRGTVYVRAIDLGDARGRARALAQQSKPGAVVTTRAAKSNRSRETDMIDIDDIPFG